MTPLEAWSVISQCMDELMIARHAINPMTKGNSHLEIEAQVIAFEALRRMEEDGEQE